MEQTDQYEDIEERSILDGLFNYIAILLQYKKPILISTFIMSVLILAFSIISLKLPPEKSPLPNLYKAYAIVLFQEGISNAGMSTMLSAFGIDSAPGGSSASQLAIEVLTSRQFIDKIVMEFNIVEKYEIEEKLKTRSREIIRQNSSYSLKRDTGSLTISYTDIDPVFASQLVNYEVQLLEDWFLEQGVILRSFELTMMEEKLTNLTTEISEIEGDIRSFQQQYGVLDIMEIAAAQSAMLTDLRTRLNQVELEISEYSDYSTIDDPALVILKNRRNNIISQVTKIEDGYTGSDGRNMPSIDELPQLALNFSHLQADLALKNQLYQTLSERYEITKLAVAEEGVFSIMEYAEIPEEKVGPSRSRLCIIVALSTFITSIVISLLHNIIIKWKDQTT